MANNKNTKKNNSARTRREPYQRQASIENAGARIGMGMLFLILGACTAVSYFVQDGTVIVGIRKFLSGVLGYGFWALAVCFLWVSIIIFQGKAYSGIRIFCILLIPLLFSGFIDVLSYKVSQSVSSSDVSVQAERFFSEGQNFKCGGAISGLLVGWMVQLLSRIGTGIVICILLIVCVALAVSEPQGWYASSSKKTTKTSRNTKTNVKPQKNKASASGVGATLGSIWSGESGKYGKQPIGGRFDPASLIRMNDDNGGDTLYDLRFDSEKKQYSDIPEEEPFPSEADDSVAFSEKSNFSGIRDDETLSVPNVAPRNIRKNVLPKNAKHSDSPEFQTKSEKPIRPDISGRSDGTAQTGTGARRTSATGLNSSAVRNAGQPRVTIVRKPVSEDKELTEEIRNPFSNSGNVLEDKQILQPTSADRKRPIAAVPVSNEIEPNTVSKDAAILSGRKQARATASTRNDIKEEKQVTAKEARSAARSIASQISKNSEKDLIDYEFPPSSLLNAAKSAGADSDREIYENKVRLENALHSFGVNSVVSKTTHGPTVTRYDIELEQGVKLTKVTNLSNDLALALGVSSVRIAPIPDEISTVGIEVPNKIVNTVSLKELIESDNFLHAKSKLSFAIGKDIGGNAIIGNISKLPHMLIAGTTGSGKSVCMNSLILSLLYKAKPDEVKFIMIDPKMVELGIYNSIPHLYVPVVTEPKKAAGALQWSVVEMLKRYRLFSEAGVRELEGYNHTCKENAEQPLPQVVIVIDELADLMMAASKEVEESICRIAQMGRAAGMHLVIATQRPSADVITGLMKANIPSRIAFAVSSALESRIILDQGGADKLIGHGDMLYAPIGCGKPLRVQGSFVSDEEREKIIKFISAHSSFTPQANDEINSYMDKAMEGKNGSSSGQDNASVSSDKSSGIADGYDEMLPDAVEVVLEMKSCSVSMLQRRIKLGYSRAARIVDQMEELGIVGPYEGAKPRSVIISRDDWNLIKSEKLGLSGSDDYSLAAEMNE